MPESATEVAVKFAVILGIMVLAMMYWRYIVAAFWISYGICWVSFVYNSWPHILSPKPNTQ